MSSNLLGVIQRHRQAGIALDTNIFLLLIVGSLDCQLLATSSKTAQFNEEDFSVLTKFCSVFPQKYITPQIVTETCNLLDTLNRQTSTAIFAQLKTYLENMKESHRPSSRLASFPVFANLGIADSSLFALANAGKLILTDDLTLYGNIVTRNLGALNFNHLRNWSI